MLKCWQWTSTNRPTFSELVKILEEILTTDEPALNRVSCTVNPFVAPYPTILFISQAMY